MVHLIAHFLSLLISSLFTSLAVRVGEAETKTETETKSGAEAGAWAWAGCGTERKTEKKRQRKRKREMKRGEGQGEKEGEDADRDAQKAPKPPTPEEAAQANEISPMQRSQPTAPKCQNEGHPNWRSFGRYIFPDSILKACQCWRRARTLGWRVITSKGTQPINR